MRGARANQMAEFDHLTSQCDEILMLIFFSLDGRTVLRLAQTCRKLYRLCSYDQLLWSRMCLMDFAIGLVSPQPFACFRHLYKCIYQSREILKFHLSDEYQQYANNRFGVFPSWLWTWVVFNTNPPLLPEWIRNYHEPFLRYKLGEISLGKTLRVWGLKSSDLPEHIVTRVEYGTCYYRWRDIQVAAMRAHGGPKGFEKFMLKRCWRARGYIERAFERIQNGTYMLPNRSKHGGENSAQIGESSHSMQIAQIFAQIANAPWQAGNGSGSVAQASNIAQRSLAPGSRQNAHVPGQLMDASINLAHVFGQITHGSGQVAHASRLVAHGVVQAEHASGHVAREFESESLGNAFDVGESSRESGRSVAYVFSSSSDSSMEIE